MKDSKCRRILACCWDLRLEVIGAVLLVLGTLLTLATANGVGIAAMFFVGAFLLCHKRLRCISGCECESCPEDCCEEDKSCSVTEEKKAK